jgi:hypothetical protein
VISRVRRDRLGDSAELASPEGAVYEGRIARLHGPSNPLRYPSKAGRPARAELRDASELKKLAARAVGKPIIVLHPRNGKHLRAGGQALVVGHVGETRVDGDHAIAKLVFTHPEGPRAMVRGVRELSLGYDADLDEDGFQRNTDVDHLALVPRARCGATCEVRTDEDDMESENCDDEMNQDGKLTAATRHELPPADFAVPSAHELPLENADHVRDAMARFGAEKHWPSAAAKKAAYHHILSRANALGIDAKHFEQEWGSRLDSACSCNSRAIGHDDQGSAMDEQTKKLIEESAAHKARADQAEKDRDAHYARADQAEKDRDKARVEAHASKTEVGAEKKRADAAEEKAKADVEKARLDAEGEFEGRVNARVELVSAATPIIGKDAKGNAVDLAKMTDRAIQAAVITHVDGEEVSEDETDDFVAGMFKVAVRNHARAAGSHSTVRTTVEKGRQDARKPVNSRVPSAAREKAARIAMQNRSRRTSTGVTNDAHSVDD